MLDPVFGFPTFVRFCWSTTQTILDNDAVDCEWEEVKGEEVGEETSGKKGGGKTSVKCVSMTKYLKRGPDNSPDGQRGAKRHCGERSQTAAFFSDRDLKRVTRLQELI